ncbi:hypothetical protein V2J09_013677 [Rumex salicifolius]
MSWLRQAVNKAVEVGKNKNNITRTVRSYADTVVQHAGQAVSVIQDRIGGLHYRSYKQAIKRLEDAAVSSKGTERTQLLKRWVVLLKEFDKLSTEDSSEDKEKEKTLEQQFASADVKESSKKGALVLYYDSDEEGEPMNFRDVFLHSQALEGVVLSMILEAPNEEEVSLLLQMFEICLSGGKEIHNAVVSSIQDLAKAFSSYEDEVLVKREELLQFAQVAVSGLKINADLARIDAEASILRQKLDELRATLQVSHQGPEEESTSAKLEALKGALAHIRICSKLEGLLRKKKMLHNGDTPEVHAQKVDKLKVLEASLANSSVKADKRISDTRFQREEALKFRATKENEVGELEKEIAAEIAGLEKERDELEAALKKVNISLTVANKRLQQTKEEKDQFEEANEQIVSHLNRKEDELSRTIGSCKVESDVLRTWINFLEDAWALQGAYTETKDKQANDELEKHEDYFVNLAINLLSGYKKELEPAISRIRNFVQNLKILSEGSDVIPKPDDEDPNPRKNLEEEYLDFEAKIITTFSVVDNMREHLYAQKGKFSRKGDPKVEVLLDDIEKLRLEFESIERPNLQMEYPERAVETPESEKSQEIPSQTITQASEELKVTKEEHSEPIPVKVEKSAVNVEQVLDHEAELAKLESEFGNIEQEYNPHEIGDWEFDELERELKD